MTKCVWEWCKVWKSVELHWNFYGVKQKRTSKHEGNYNMQMNKAIFRNSKIIIFNKKKIEAVQVSFLFQPAGSEADFFFMSARFYYHLLWLALLGHIYLP